jgi:hypothetical protein
MNLCSHGMNPVSCPWCYQVQQRTPKVSGKATTVAPPQKDTSRFVRPPDPPQPRATNPAAMAQYPNGAPPITRAFDAPHREGSSPPQRDDKLWEPPKHGHVSENMPSHPEAGKR